MAQEVAALFPDAVRMGSTGYLELHVDPVRWAAVNAVRELADENTQLKKKDWKKLRIKLVERRLR